MKKKMLSIIAVILLLILASCSQKQPMQEGQEQETQQEQSTQTEATSQGSGLQSHQIWSASSEDGLTWTYDDILAVDEASVSIPLLLPDGTIRLYYVDGSVHPSTVGCSESTNNGATFTKLDCNIEGSETLNVDPTIVQLDDETYRLYYFAGTTDPEKGIGDPASMPGDHNINYATSVDGIHFEEQGTVFTAEGIMDPDVFYTGEKYILYSATNLGKSVIATSDDGIEFTYYGDFPIERMGLSKPITLADGTFRMYVFNQQGQKEVLSLISEDGLSWTQEDGVRLEAPEDKEITDTQVVQLADGTYKMFFKLSNPPTPPSKKE